MIVSLFFFLMALDCSASSASTRWSRSVRVAVSTRSSVTAMSGPPSDQVAEGTVLERLGAQELVPAELGPRRHVGLRARVGREQLEGDALGRVLEGLGEADERPGARLPSGIDGDHGCAHGGMTSRGWMGNAGAWARRAALFRCGQEQPQMRSGIIAATTPASRVRTIAGANRTADVPG